MPAPYTLDLRWRITELHFVENKTNRSIALHLRISVHVYSAPYTTKICRIWPSTPGKKRKATHYHVVNKSTASCAYVFHFKQSCKLLEGNGTVLN